VEQLAGGLPTGGTALHGLEPPGGHSPGGACVFVVLMVETLRPERYCGARSPDGVRDGIR
jgi:hypothetical protein